jgi:hypothetical protein
MRESFQVRLPAVSIAMVMLPDPAAFRITLEVVVEA